MDAINTLLAVILGLFLRLGVPVAVTILAIGLLRWLDRRWQDEGEAVRPALSRGEHCWEIKNCTEAQKAKCLACANSSIPCWQYFRSRNGLLRDTCIGCEVFRKAPIPVAGR